MKNIFGIVKPTGMTSHDVVNRIRRITGIQRIGHAGTLDPAASGVLVIAVGRESTKLLSSIVKKEKEYTAEMTLDGKSTTGDAEGKITSVENVAIPDLQEVEHVLQACVGEILLTPPAYSAIKVRGKPAYVYARKNQTLSLQARPSRIYSVERISYHWPLLRIRVVTGSGVYIRSLAEWIGTALNVGGYITVLVRERVGEFTLSSSLTLKQFEEKERFART